MRGLALLGLLGLAACGSIVGVDGDYQLSTKSTSSGGTSAPSGWRCPASNYDDGGECDCNCGAADPDCDLEGASFPYTCSSGTCSEADYSVCNSCEKGRCIAGQ